VDGKKKHRYFVEMKKSAFIVGLLLIAAAVFEFSPAVKDARHIIPEDIYAEKTCGCQCIADSRPWYSTFNYWHWLWVVMVPVLIFSIKFNAARFQKLIVVLVSAGLCYLFMNFSIHLFWDIRNGPFIVSPDPNAAWQKTWAMECAYVGDGASLSFTLIFGWIPASLYAGFCYAAWRISHSFLKSRTV
jgi:hypothetical protein